MDCGQLFIVDLSLLFSSVSCCTWSLLCPFLFVDLFFTYYLVTFLACSLMCLFCSAVIASLRIDAHTGFIDICFMCFNCYHDLLEFSQWAWFLCYLLASIGAFYNISKNQDNPIKTVGQDSFLSPKTPKNTSFLGVTQPLYSRGQN